MYLIGSGCRTKSASLPKVLDPHVPQNPAEEGPRPGSGQMPASDSGDQAKVILGYR